MALSRQRLVRIRGKWVFARSNDIKQVLANWQQINALNGQGFTFSEALRIISAKKTQLDMAIRPQARESSMNEVVEEISPAGGFKDSLEKLAHENSHLSPEEELILSQYLQAILRPYQKKGVVWLTMLQCLDLGGCLADDMGLGKTLQVIAMLLIRKHSPRFKSPNGTEKHQPSLLILYPPHFLAIGNANLQNLRQRSNGTPCILLEPP